MGPIRPKLSVSQQLHDVLVLIAYCLGRVQVQKQVCQTPWAEQIQKVDPPQVCNLHHRSTSVQNWGDPLVGFPQGGPGKQASGSFSRQKLLADVVMISPGSQNHRPSRGSHKICQKRSPSGLFLGEVVAHSLICVWGPARNHENHVSQYHDCFYTIPSKST